MKKISKKRVLITGVCGFLGQNLSRQLLKAGYEITGLDDLSIGKLDWLPKEVDFYKMDVSLGSWVYRFKHHDYIIHLASMKIPREGTAELVLLKNTDAIFNVAEYTRNNNVKLVFLSTSDVYGKQATFSEDSDSIIGKPDISRWSYAISKMWGEQLIYSSLKKNCFNIIRLFGSYGPYHALSWTAGPQSVFISQALEQKPITLHGSGEQKRCFQYVDDAIDGILRIMETNHYNHEIFNIGNPNEEISIKDLGEMIWYMINPEIKYQYKYVEPSISKYEEIDRRIPVISKANRLLGFEPRIGLKEGLKKTIDWQKRYINEKQGESPCR